MVRAPRGKNISQKLPTNYVENAAEKIKDFYISKSTKELTNRIDQFFQQCIPEHLREATSDLMAKIRQCLKKCPDLSTFKINRAVDFINKQIFYRFRSFWKDINEELKNTIYSGHVSCDVWKNAFIDAVRQDVSIFFDVFDALFHVAYFENPKKESAALLYICKMLYDKKTFNNAISWIQTFDSINLQKLADLKKSFNNKNLAPEGVQYAWTKLVADKSKKLCELYSNGSIHQFLTCIAEFYSNCRKEWIRGATMDLIYNTDLLLFKIEDADHPLVIYQIFVGFTAFLNRKGKKFSKKALTVDVSDELWAKSFKVALRQKRSACYPTLNKLYRTNLNVNNARFDIIVESVRELFSSEETLNNGIEKVKHFGLNLEDLKINTADADVEDEQPPWLFIAENIFTIIEQLNYDRVKCAKALGKFFNDRVNNKSDKLDAFFEEPCAASELITPCSLEFVRPATMKLISMIDLIHEHSSDIVYNICEQYEQSARGRVKTCTTVVSDDLWIKTWKICSKIELLLTSTGIFETLFRVCKPENKMREDVICESVRKMLSKIETFNAAITWISKLDLKRLKEEFYGHVVIYSCIFGDGRKIVFENFTRREASDNLKMAILQLATTKWTCLLHIQELAHQLSQEEWIVFFKLLFDPDIARIGFSFKSDYTFLCNRFMFLKDLFRDPRRKVLCLQRLAKYILKNKDIVKKVFCNELLKDSFGLADLAKAVMNITLDKSEQESDWTKSCLTQFQKIYAVSDAVIVVLLKDQIEKTLNTFFANNAIEIIENGYVYYGIPELTFD